MGGLDSSFAPTGQERHWKTKDLWPDEWLAAVLRRGRNTRCAVLAITTATDIAPGHAYAEPVSSAEQHMVLARLLPPGYRAMAMINGGPSLGDLYSW